MRFSMVSLGRTAALAIVVAAAAVVASSAGPSTVNAATDATAAVERLDNLSNQFGGSIQQRRAGELIAYHNWQDPIQNCMAAAGFSYTPPPFVDIYAGKEQSPATTTDGRWFAPLRPDGLELTSDAVRLAAFDQEHPNPGYTKLSDTDKKRYDTTLTGCLPKTARDDHLAASFAKVQQPFSEMTLSVADSQEVSKLASQYPSCMKEEGFEVASYTDLVTDVQKRIGTERPAVGRRSASSGWSNAVAYDKKAGVADATCRKPIRERALALVASRIDNFERDHAAGLKQIQQEWNDMVQQAKKYPEAAQYLK